MSRGHGGVLPRPRELFPAASFSGNGPRSVETNKPMSGSRELSIQSHSRGHRTARYCNCLSTAVAPSETLRRIKPDRERG